MNNYWLNEYTKINKGDGYHFEQFVCKLYAEYHDVDVKLNGKTNDKGVDLIIENKVGVQVKYYSTSLGIKPIQEIYAGISYYRLNRGVVITNSSYNSNAIDFAKRVGIELIDGNDILVMINRLSLGKKSPRIEKERKCKLIEESKATSLDERSEPKVEDYKTIKLYNKLEKAKRFENKINDFNKHRRTSFISSLEEVHNLTIKNEKLYNQVFSKFNLIQIFEIDETENRTLIELTMHDKELNPQLKNVKFLYPPVNENIFMEYIKILKLDISDERKIAKIKGKQLKQLIVIIILIVSFILSLIYIII